MTTYTPEKTVSFENLVKLYASQAMAGKKLLDSMVCVDIHLWISVPASWSKKKQHQAITGEIRPMTKPDADNVAKAICDAMNEIVYTDDKQIVDLRVSKFYAEQPRSEVTVSPLGAA
ncbi:phage protein [Limnobacter litoralis]|uniref:Phage protein n=1 Tax=Limnobacter litoralis TaxID=481366 RepID=A0ABQ5YSX3_9BURK|nr:phage protein [Limnobacter litoralis]